MSAKFLNNNFDDYFKILCENEVVTLFNNFVITF